MAFDMEAVMVCLENCDKRIAKAQSEILAWEKNENVLLRMEQFANTEHEFSICEKLRPELSIKRNWENNLKLIRVEKLIYISLTQSGNNALFPRLLARYDELMRESYDLVSDRVQEGLQEDLYLKYCKLTLGQRDYIKAMCDYGMTR